MMNVQANGTVNRIESLPKTPSKSHKIIALIIAYVESQGDRGATHDEAYENAGIKKFAAPGREVKGTWARWNELKRGGVIKIKMKDGVPVRRRTVEGKMAEVYVHVEGKTILDWMRDKKHPAPLSKGDDEPAVLAHYRKMKRRWSSAGSKQRETMIVNFAQMIAQIVQEVTTEPAPPPTAANFVRKRR